MGSKFICVFNFVDIVKLLFKGTSSVFIATSSSVLPSYVSMKGLNLIVHLINNENESFTYLLTDVFSDLYNILNFSTEYFCT